MTASTSSTTCSTTKDDELEQEHPHATEEEESTAKDGEGNPSNNNDDDNKTRPRPSSNNDDDPSNEPPAQKTKHDAHSHSHNNTHRRGNVHTRARTSADLHVEAMIHPCSPTPFPILRKEIERYIYTRGQSTLTYHAGILVAKDLCSNDYHDDGNHIAPAPPILQSSCLELAIYIDDIGDDDDNGHDDGNESTKSSTKSIASWMVRQIHVYTYTLNDAPPEPEEIDDLSSNDNEPITVCHTMQLPHASLHTSWDHLIVPCAIKRKLQSYAWTGLYFSHQNVSPHIINWNRILLLHGPPGTGKTTLCRALAQKLCIRMMQQQQQQQQQQQYNTHTNTNTNPFPSLSGAGGYLLEVQSHSLFSKWFSESGKLISCLFARIREMVEDEPDALFCVLMDEIESLASSRWGVGNGSGNGNGNGSEPSDAVRAVNSLLTSLDSIRSLPNVIVLCTTNMTHCVDAAFVDRVDWSVAIGLPSEEARYEILRSCVNELMRVGVVVVVGGHGRRRRHGGGSGSGNGNARDIGSNDDDDNGDGNVVGMDDADEILGYDQAIQKAKDRASSTSTSSSSLSLSLSPLTDQNVDTTNPELMLLECAKLSNGLSGRSLRKLPFQSHAFHIRSSGSGGGNGNGGVDVVAFMRALSKSIRAKQRGEI